MHFALKHYRDLSLDQLYTIMRLRQRVFVLEPDTLPLRWRGQRPQAAEQERNLLYVALTRAREHLFLVRSPGASFADDAPGSPTPRATLT